jgi:3-oxoacyl-[acyl-carrier-protein] synthase-3
VGAECLSKITDYQDRNTCILFGDGAGAVVLRPSTDRGELLYAINGIDGNHPDVMHVPGGGSRIPASEESVQKRLHYMRVRGREVYKFAVNKMVELIRKTADQIGISVSEISRIIPHQVNLRILESAREKLDLPEGVIFSNIDRFGNTSAASIPIALADAKRQQLLSRGNYVFFVAFGAGLSWGAVATRW